MPLTGNLENTKEKEHFNFFLQTVQVIVVCITVDVQNVHPSSAGKLKLIVPLVNVTVHDGLLHSV